MRNARLQLVANPDASEPQPPAAESRRDSILRAAREEFNLKGLEGASMRGIATRAGCTTGAIYPQFDSKQAIYAALLHHSLTQLEATLASARRPDDAPEAQVRATCAAFVGYYLAHPFELNLGLYAFRGLKRQGVGRRTDESLNAALWQALDRLSAPLAAWRQIDPAAARPLVVLAFSQMMGALVLHLAGRLQPLGVELLALQALMVDSLRPR
jgi:AcrR family transcriptional regulator